MTDGGSSLEAVVHVARRLGDLVGDVVFVGGAVVPLLVTEAGVGTPGKSAEHQ